MILANHSPVASDMVLANHCHDPIGFWAGVIIHLGILILVLGSFIVYRVATKRKR